MENEEKKYYEKQRHLTKSAVMLYLTRNINGTQEVLMQLRINTGYADNMWDASASGHVEKNESVTQATVREAKEELNIDVKRNDLTFIGVIHQQTEYGNGDAYFNFYFMTENYSGDIEIHEPKKCGGLKWFPINDLPINIIPERKQILENFSQGIYFSEGNWESKKNDSL